MAALFVAAVAANKVFLKWAFSASRRNRWLFKWTPLIIREQERAKGPVCMQGDVCLCSKLTEGNNS